MTDFPSDTTSHPFSSCYEEQEDDHAKVTRRKYFTKSLHCKRELSHKLEKLGVENKQNLAHLNWLKQRFSQKYANLLVLSRWRSTATRKTPDTRCDSDVLSSGEEIILDRAADDGARRGAVLSASRMFDRCAVIPAKPRDGLPKMSCSSAKPSAGLPKMSCSSAKPSAGLPKMSCSARCAVIPAEPPADLSNMSCHGEHAGQKYGSHNFDQDYSGIIKGDHIVNAWRSSDYVHGHYSYNSCLTQQQKYKFSPIPGKCAVSKSMPSISTGKTHKKFNRNSGKTGFGQNAAEKRKSVIGNGKETSDEIRIDVLNLRDEDDKPSPPFDTVDESNLNAEIRGYCQYFGPPSHRRASVQEKYESMHFLPVVPERDEDISSSCSPSGGQSNNGGGSMKPCVCI